MKVEVVFLPPIATDLGSKVCVVIDVLRATSTLVSMFAAGARTVTLSDSPAHALAHAAMQADRPLVCGESGGLPPDGFDYGNSPREFLPNSLSGRDLVMCTSNGTRAMGLVSEAPVVLAGSLLNGSTVARRAVMEARALDLDIALICSGDYLGTKFAIDDAFCAGHLVTLIEKEANELTPGGDPPEVSSHSGGAGLDNERVREVGLDESALAALRLYRSYLRHRSLGLSERPPRDAIMEAFWESHNAQVLRSLGLSADVEYSAQLDISYCVPRLRVVEGRLELVSSEQ